ncbi:MAG: hypothetical protein J2P29_06625 [Actinobacteria bacterium]|nr:hypothetical protein [Actinomycetota bacterium]
MTIHRRISYILGCSALAVSALALAACSSSPSSSTTPPATTAPASPTAGATANGNAAAQITTNWEAFFSAKTPVSQRVALLQNGSQFQSVISAQAGGGLAAQASAKVTKVTITSPTQATVTYNILLNGQPALSNQTGTAVLESGTWKVGVASFCGLLSLENGGKTTGLPAACQGA